jgi:8-oxo-dGTP diphosphatase/2-hydroxy-dATP diphosphatase
VKVDDLEQVGVIDFEWVGQSVLHEVHVFKASQFTGEPEETEEMRPQWFPEESIPFTQMWLDDKVWYPFLLQDVKFKGYFLFRGNTEILSYTLRDYLDDGKVLLGFETDPHLEAAKFS